jgi:hypothetical protein
MRLAEARSWRGLCPAVACSGLMMMMMMRRTFNLDLLGLKFNKKIPIINQASRIGMNFREIRYYLIDF